MNFSARFNQIKSLVILFALTFTLSATAFAQNGGSISGSVTDQNSAVISGAEVILINTANDQEMVMMTDSAGKFEFKNLPPAPYFIKVRQGGFSGTSANLTLGSGENKTHDFRLSLGSLAEEVTVTAAKGLRATSEIPQSVTVIGEQEIEQRRPVGIGDAYDRSPSTLGTDPNPFRTRPQIRGLQSSRILVTIDGERLNNSRFAADFVGVSPSLVDVSQIQTVEVIAGSASSLYGSDAIGGAVNIITKGASRQKDGRRFDFKFDGDYGSNNKYRKGAVALGYGEKHVAGRINFARFIFPNYHLGGDAISRAEVANFGNFAARAGNAIGQNVVGSYAVYDFPGNGEVLNSQARGMLGGADVQFYPDDRQTARIRYQINRYRDLGVGFSGSPTGVNQANTKFSNLDKLSFRYELRDITSWFPRLQVSVFDQVYRRSLNELRTNIVVGSSCVPVTATTPPFGTSCPANTTLNGNASTFIKSLTSQTINRNRTKGWDTQFNFIPFKNALYITGLNYSFDSAHDVFGQDTFNNAGVVTANLTDVRNTPDTDYRNVGWYNQFEYTPVKYVRFAGGFRYDDWRTEAKPTVGFPVGNVTNIISAIVPRLQASPQSFNVSGASSILSLLTGTSSIKTQSKTWTYNVGVTGFIKGGINPYFRYSTSFREPDLTSRFLVRNFFASPSVISFVGLTNAELKPERGRDIDLGVKLARRQVRGSVAYYRNTLSDATGTVTGSYCLPAQPAVGIIGGACVLAAGPPPTLGHNALVFQTVNFAKVVIKGVEAEIEGDIPVGDVGSLTPYFSLGQIKATNKNPDASRLAIVSQFYNSSAPLELEGSATDVPFYSLPKYKYTFAPRFTSAKGNWWAEYEFRGTTKITRVDAGEISFAQATQYYYFGAYKGFKKHSIRGGFKFGEDVPVSLTIGVDNLLNKTYYSLFQPAPAMGRTFTIGTTINFSKIFK